MAKKFEALAARSKESWTREARTVNEAASKVFQAEVAVQVALGRDLRAARRLGNMTQSDLAERTGVDQAEISRIENGRANPTLETIARLASALDSKLVLEPDHQST